MGLADFAGFRVFRRRDDGRVDRAEGADEVRPGDAQPDLRVLPRPVELLAFQRLAHRIADRDQFLDDPGMLFRNAIGAAALAHRNRDWLTIEDLHQA